MNYTDEEISETIEKSLHLIKNPIEDLFYLIDDNRFYGTVVPSMDFDEANRIGMTRLNTHNVEDAIQKILKIYASHNLSEIGWTLSDQTTPKNLSVYLEKFGFGFKENWLGMVRSLSEPLNIDVSNEFEFRKVTVEYMKTKEMHQVDEIAYGLPKGTGEVISKIMDEQRKVVEITDYVAFYNNQPVGFSSISYLPNTRLALLSGAATLPEFRKRGVYSGMLKMRYDQAKNDGIEYLIIHAKEDSSAPIARKHGFRVVCTFPFYVLKSQLDKVLKYT